MVGTAVTKTSYNDQMLVPRTEFYISRHFGITQFAVSEVRKENLLLILVY